MLLIVVVGGVNIGDGMDKAQDKPFGGPVDHNIDSHVVLIQGDLIHVRERCGSAAEAKLPADAGKA